MSKPNSIMIDNQKYVREDSVTTVKPLTDFPSAEPRALIGRTVFIRTVTNFYTGLVRDVQQGMLLLSNAAWIADTGRFSDALKTGKLNEVEPMGDTMVALSAVVDISPWRHALPEVQK